MYPREDADPDEALWANDAQVDDDPDLESVVRAQLDGHGVECHGTVRIVSARVARAAREHIEAEREEGGYNIRRAERERKRRVKAEEALDILVKRQTDDQAKIERLTRDYEALRAAVRQGGSDEPT